MKIIRISVFVAFLIFSLSFLDKIFLIVAGASEPIVFGLFLLVITSIVYMVTAFIQSTERIEAGMVASGIPIYVGLLFSTMLWPGGAILIIAGCGTLLMVSLGVLIYTLIKQRNVFLGICYCAFGFGSLFFCFKYMFWPGAAVIFVPFIIGFLAAVVYFFVKKVPLERSSIASLILAVILIALFTKPTSDIYRIKYLDIYAPNTNFPENFHKYAWYLYKDGEFESAKVNLKIAIEQAQNPYNVFSYRAEIRDDIDAVARYERALKLVDVKQWDYYEKSPFAPY